MKKYMFTAKWCGNCQVMKPIVSKISDVEIIDVDENLELVEKYNIMSLPSYIFDTGILTNFGSGIKPVEWVAKFYSGGDLLYG